MLTYIYICTSVHIYLMKMTLLLIFIDWFIYIREKELGPRKRQLFIKLLWIHNETSLNIPYLVWLNIFKIKSWLLFEGSASAMSFLWLLHNKYWDCIFICLLFPILWAISGQRLIAVVFQFLLKLTCHVTGNECSINQRFNQTSS